MIGSRFMMGNRKTPVAIVVVVVIAAIAAKISCTTRRSVKDNSISTSGFLKTIDIRAQYEAESRGSGTVSETVAYRIVTDLRCQQCACDGIGIRVRSRA